MSAKPGRLAVGIIGAGRVGAVLGSALRAVGHEVVGVSGGSPVLASMRRWIAAPARSGINTICPCSRAKCPLSVLKLIA